ncbi:unnamed protein product, partial [Prorocentrum cordatum]
HGVQLPRPGPRARPAMASRPYCKVWAATQDDPVSESFLTAYMVGLSVAALALIIRIKSLRPKDLSTLLEQAGVAIDKVAKTSREIERKTFHLAGLLVPLIHQMLLMFGATHRFCMGIVWSITVVGWTCDLARVHVPFVQRHWPLKSILRDSEKDQLSGGSYFSLGCTLAVAAQPSRLAMTSVIFLVLGDMSAALIGRSFGKSIFKVGIGPEGKKSVEGSAAMFLVCFVFGCTIFSQVHLREYAVFTAALVATLAELYTPFGLNDNMPDVDVLAGIALTFGFQRTYSCEPSRNPLHWHSR